MRIRQILGILFILIIVFLPAHSVIQEGFSCDDFLAKVKKGENLLKGEFQVTRDHVNCLIDNIAQLDKKAKAHAISLLCRGNDRRIVPFLCTYLKDKELTVTAQYSLEYLGDPAVIEPLIRLIREGVYIKRFWAIISAIDDPLVERSLLTLISEISGDFKQKALKFLAERQNPGVFIPLIEELNTSELSRVQKAIENLALLKDPNCVDHLCKIFIHGKNNLKIAVAQALAQFKGNNNAIKLLIGALKDEDDGVKREAAAALQKIGNSSAVMPLFEALFTVTEGPCQKTAGEIAYALESLVTKEHASLIPSLVEKYLVVLVVCY